MKTLSKLGIVLALGSSLFTSCSGEYYVADQPVEPVYERPAQPYQDAVWIDGDWAYHGGRYVHNQGHWEHARAGHTYVKGNWHHTSKGYSYHRGHWQ